MASASTSDDDIAAIEKRLSELDAERIALQSHLAQLRAQPDPTVLPAIRPGEVTRHSSPTEKIALFRSLFRGRTDLFPLRWSNSRTGRSGYAPACSNEWVQGVCGKIGGKFQCGACPNSAFRPVTDSMIEWHLRGKDNRGREFAMGVYPILPDDTCGFLAADFDKSSWQRDASSFVAACRREGIAAALERSRSGNGAHVWIFFADPVPAQTARRLGALLLTETMEANPDIGFDSYDRFFPSQDSLPAGGFGNLIALPLQHRPRLAENSVFVDDSFRPFPDQWAHLSSLRQVPVAEVESLADEARRKGRVIGLRLPVHDEDEKPWLLPPSRRTPTAPIREPLPDSVELVLADQLFIPRSELPEVLVNRLIRLAAFQNPEFYSRQAMRLSTHGEPRIISCAELYAGHIALPRGCREEAEALLSSLGVDVRIDDQRNAGSPVEAVFTGELTPLQQKATKALLGHDFGVLAAATAFGKTVVAASIIASRGTSTLIAVHRQQLLDQWIAQLSAFLELPANAIGRIGGGKRKPRGTIDVAMIQSLLRDREADDLVADYGQLIVDECHHLAAASFEKVARRAKARYFLGLSATVARKDGRHPVIFMQCGPVRFRVHDRQQAAQRPFGHKVVLRRTAFTLPGCLAHEQLPIQRIYAELAQNEERNALIVADVRMALQSGRSPMILTDRREHVRLLAEQLSRFSRDVVVLQGGMTRAGRMEVARRMAEAEESPERVLIATGRYIGEGFDDARLDALFLTMPIAWRGTLAQYAGRLHRLHPAKRDVRIYDYVDDALPVLSRMSAKRIRGYRSLGYTLDGPPQLADESGEIWAQ